MAKRGKPRKNLTGMYFGKLHVIGDADRPAYVLCECECGQRKEILRQSLLVTKNPTRSCGCIRKEKAKEMGLKYGKERHRALKEMSVEFKTDFNILELKTPYKNNTSGFKGVCFNKRRQTYQAYICVQGKRFHLGWYPTLESAVEARKAAEEKYHKPLIEAKNMAERAKLG